MSDEGIHKLACYMPLFTAMCKSSIGTYLDRHFQTGDVGVHQADDKIE